MFKDIVLLIAFTLERIENNHVKENACMEIYDVYRQLHKVAKVMQLALSYMSREVDFDDTETSFGSPVKKWTFFVNKELKAYEACKHMLFCLISKLEAGGYSEKGILQSNFLSTALNCEITSHTKIAHLDKELQLIVYRFNLIKENCPAYRKFDELFTTITLDCSSDASKTDVINSAKEDVNALMGLIRSFETVIQKRCDVKDLFVAKNEFEEIV